jgi:hypothetical protein
MEAILSSLWSSLFLFGRWQCPPFSWARRDFLLSLEGLAIQFSKTFRANRMNKARNEYRRRQPLFSELTVLWVQIRLGLC